MPSSSGRRSKKVGKEDSARSSGPLNLTETLRKRRNRSSNNRSTLQTVRQSNTRADKRITEVATQQSETHVTDPEHLRAIVRISKELASFHEVAKLQQHMASSISECLGSELTRVFAIFPGPNDDFYLNYETVKCRAGQGILGTVLENGEVFNDEKPEKFSSYAAETDGSSEVAKGCPMLCVPMLSLGEDGAWYVQGVIQTFGKKGQGKFGDEDIAFIHTLGELGGNILRNVQMMDMMEEMYETSAAAQHRSEALLHVARALSSELDLEELVSMIIRKVRTLLGVERCTLFFTDATTNEIVVWKEGSHGEARSFVNWIKGTKTAPSLPFQKGKSEIRLPMNKGIAGFVATTGQRLHIADAYKDERFSPEMDKKTGFKTRNILCLPMREANGRIIGVVQAINKDPTMGPFNQVDEEILETFSAHAAVAVQNSHLLEKTTTALKQSEGLLEVTYALSQELKLPKLVRIIVSKVQHLLDSDRCTVFIVDREKQELYSTSSMSFGMGTALPIQNDREDVIRFPIGAGIAGHVATSGEVVNIADAYDDSRFNRSMDKKTGYRTKSILCAPIRNHKNEIVGVCQAMNKAGGSPFGPDDVQLLSAFTAQAAVAISNSELYQATERALNQSLRELRNLKFMLSVTKNLSSELQTSSMMRQMTRQLHDLLKSDHCYIYVVDTDKSEYYRINDNNEHIRLPLSRGITGAVARTGQGIRIRSGVMNDHRYDAEADSGGARAESLLCMPIIADKESDEQQVIGVISVQDEEDRGGFGQEEENLLKVFCAQASVALVNSKKFSKVIEEASNKAADRSAADFLKQNRGMQLGSDDIDSFAYHADEIQLGKSIGSGSYGEVWLAKARGQVVAVKKLYTRNLKGEQVDAFCAEASLMCQLVHPNVVLFKGAITQPPDLCIITEYCSRGSLADLLMETSEMTMKLKLKFIHDAAQGMHYLHTSNPVILHRDLKSDNLLVDRDWNVKVADFGLTRFMDSQKQMTQVGTPMWMAPEVILGEQYTQKADVYSFGIIMWEILTQKEPYEDKETMQIVVEVVNEGLRPKVDSALKKNILYPLMVDCWHQNPDQRPTFKAVCERLAKIQIDE